MRRWAPRRTTRILLTALVCMTGCRQSAMERHYLGEAGPSHYRGHATAIEYPNVVQPTAHEVQVTLEPHTVRDGIEFEIRPISLHEVVCLALQNAQIIRTNGQFLSPGNQVLQNPEGVASVYDAAIQETGVLFGRRGVEAALADFDANFTANMLWGRNETIPNNQLRRVISAETATFESSLSKQFANGAAVQVQHNIDYLGTNNPTVLFPSSYTGELIASYRHPLLAGSGVEYTRVAGPIRSGFGGITGVSQGVVIARINNDLTLAQFEGALHELVNDVENAYWDLYLAYRNFNTAATARDAAQGTWELADKQAPAILLPADEAQARDQLFAARALVINTRSELFTSETRLRRLLGLPVNDGVILQPSDEPVTAEVVPEWYASLMEALTHRVELHAQKWHIRSLELQLEAARSLTQPRLDAVASWQLNGFGDQLFPHSDVYPGAPPGYRSMYERMAAGTEQGWNAGVQLNVPIGFRQAHAQVRNYELRLAKARKVLAEQEKEIAQELAAIFQEVARGYESAIENFNRYQAAVDNVEKLRPASGATLDVDVILRAQERRAQAEVAYFNSLISYNKSLTQLQFRKGVILAQNNIHLREGPWVPAAHEDAQRRYEHRAHSFEAPWKESQPSEFASPFPIGSPSFQTEAAASALGSGVPGWMDAPEMPPGLGDAPPADGAPPQPPGEQLPGEQPPGEQPPGKATVPPPAGDVDPFAAPVGEPRVRSPLSAPPPAPPVDEGIQPVGWWNRTRLSR
jgi:outer membrane protein TolC